MDNLERIRRRSILLRRLATLMLWATPVLCAAYWAFFNEFPEAMRAKASYPAARGDLSALNRLLGFGASLAPAGAAVYGFAALRALFGLYAAGELFTARNVACYRRLGRALLYWAGAVFIYTPLASLAVSAGLPPGQRHVTVGLGSVELAALFAGSAALVISWVMDEGRHIEEDRALTI